MVLNASNMYKDVATGKRRTGVAAKFVEDRLAEGRVAFALSELLESSGLTAVAANNQLRRTRIRVSRVSRSQPFFVIVAPQHRPLGAPPVEWWLDDYFRWLGHPYYLALLSAAETYGSAPQAVQIHQVMTDTPRREVAVGRLRIRFFVKSGIGRTPVQQPANAYSPLNVSTPEATVLDLVRYASRIGGLGRALETITPLLPSIRSRELNGALDAEGETATAQRLGYLLEHTGERRLAELVHRWLPSPTRWATLGINRPAPEGSHRSERWRLVVHGGEL
jgi:hypothetical protein